MKPLPVLLLAGITASVAAAETTIPAAGLREDVEIARKAYTSLHPGLYRYNTPEEIEAAFDELADGFAEGSTLSEAYLAFAELLASIRCGHTYGNFWNQSAEVQEQLFNGAD
ncbi:MAG: peptidase S41, partial [Thermoanaerobaculia bacterium]